MRVGWCREFRNVGCCGVGLCSGSPGRGWLIDGASGLVYIRRFSRGDRCWCRACSLVAARDWFFGVGFFPRIVLGVEGFPRLPDGEDEVQELAHQVPQTARLLAEAAEPAGDAYERLATAAR